MRRRQVLGGAAALALLGACVPKGPRGPSLRDSAAPFGAVLRFDPGRFAGDWDVVGAIGAVPGGRQVWAPAAGRLHLLHEGGDRVMRPGVYGTAQAGRLTPEAGETVWVLWIDDGHRTAVLAVPSGRWALILNRGARIPADRRRAALDILGWSGFDLSHLREVTA